MLSVVVNNKQQLSKAEVLLLIYQKQPALYQRLLQIKALIFKGQSKKNFIEFILRSNLLAQRSQKLNAKQLQDILDQLVKLKLLATDFNCDLMIIDKLTQLALSEQNPDRQTNLATLNNSYLIGYEQSYVAQNNARTVRIAIYLNDVEFFINKKLNNFLNCRIMVDSIIEGFYQINVNLNWLATRNPIIKALLCCAKLQCFFNEVTFLAPDLQNWLDFFKTNDLSNVVKNYDFLQSKFLQIKICMAANIALSQTISAENAFYAQETLGALSLLTGNFNKAERYFITALKTFSKIYNNKKEWYKNNLYVIFYALAIFAQNSCYKAQAVINTLKKVEYNYPLVELLQVLLCLQQNYLDGAKNSLIAIENRLQKINKLSLIFVLYEVIKFLLVNDRKTFTIQHGFRKKFLEQASISNFFAAQLYAECLLYVEPEDGVVQAFFTKNYFPNFRLLKLFVVKQPWEYAIDQLRQVVIPKNNYLINLNNKRLVWLIDPEQNSINVVEQNLKAHGVWSGRKPIALKRFYYIDPTLGYISEHDLRVIKCLTKELNNWRSEEYFSWDYKQAIKALIGHPLIFHQRDPVLHLELVKGELELKIAAVEDGYLLSLKYHYNMPVVILEQETCNRYRVIDYPEAAVNISKIIPKNGLKAPKEAQSRIIDIIHNTKLDITICSDLEDDQIPIVLADPSCWVQLLPINNGLKITLVVRPLGENGPYYPVAYGPKQVIANIMVNNTEVKQKAIRDLSQEQQSADLL